MKAWKDSASLIVAARQGLKHNRSLPPTTIHYDYRLLCLKRHQNSSFMPGTYVFPGGLTEAADADLKWKKQFAAFGFDGNSFSSLFPENQKRPQIFKAELNELPREISLRITAIRETFEECGILLCKRLKKNNSTSEWAEVIPRAEVQSWQNKVHNDATEFYKLCEGLQCYPDLWALHEWNNWLTPTFYTGKRYNTIFFLACMPMLPQTKIESTEMEDITWDTPKNLISSSKVLLGPPQHYEISRIANFECLDNLLEFAVRVKLSDGTVHVLPGDSMYPDSVSLMEKQIIDHSNMTILEFRNVSLMKNRLEFYDLEVKKIVANHDSDDGHLTPVCLDKINLKLAKKK
ncbi:nucleoside diphosphate-linked moiety X motif 19 isoform X2 [Cephus cinctus]|uniref:Nucleoside diphosphate-linked moiety X motif 19 isoform X2 n=1 Tax=Cephus cinctus TaxID=211228 RepID=A0AAJ7RQJ0_CEPCN|nr:nucleoside diphosphate-linked moiety X motif 19 isoform X2 [Cephus cinctus]